MCGECVVGCLFGMCACVGEGIMEWDSLHGEFDHVGLVSTYVHRGLSLDSTG